MMLLLLWLSQIIWSAFFKAQGSVIRRGQISILESTLPSLVRSVDACEFACNAVVDVLYLSAREIHVRARTDICQAVPFIHTKFTDTHFDIQSEVALWVNLPLDEVFTLHEFVGLFTAFDFVDKPPPRFSKIT